MRHRKGKKKLGRTTSHRDCMLSNMLVSLIKAGKIETTEAKSKVLKRHFEHTVSLAIQGDSASTREIISRVRDKEAFKTLTRNIAPRLRDRRGGYCRIIKTGYRRGDAAPLALLEILSE